MGKKYFEFADNARLISTIWLLIPDFILGYGIFNIEESFLLREGMENLPYFKVNPSDFVPTMISCVEMHVSMSS